VWVSFYKTAAQADRFQIIKNIDYKPDGKYFSERYGERIATAAVQWWEALPEDEKRKVSPRRLDYALDIFNQSGGAARAKMKNVARSHLALLGAVLAVLVWSAWRPYDRFTWWLEVTPGLVGLLVLIATYSRFRFTTLCYTLIALHICVLCVGGHYTYARVPLFEWLRPIFAWQRNNYDRLGHLMQGFVPAIIAREIFLRFGVVARTNWLPFLVVSVCLGISAFYELIEWWTALSSGAASNDFLGSQGDVWDTQSDMFHALIGAVSALVLLSAFHNRAIRKLEGPGQ
jgi:putative membrane protein